MNKSFKTLLCTVCLVGFGFTGAGVANAQPVEHTKAEKVDRMKNCPPPLPKGCGPKDRDNKADCPPPPHHCLPKHIKGMHHVNGPHGNPHPHPPVDPMMNDDMHPGDMTPPPPMRPSAGDRPLPAPEGMPRSETFNN